MKNGFICKTASCKLCGEYSRKRGCISKHCPYLAERIEASVADYAEVIRDTFKAPSFILAARLRQLLNSYCGSGWEESRTVMWSGRTFFPEFHTWRSALTLFWQIHPMTKISGIRSAISTRFLIS